MDIKGKEKSVDMKKANELEERFNSSFVKKNIKSMNQYYWEVESVGKLMIVLSTIVAIAYIIISLTGMVDYDGSNIFVVSSWLAVIVGTAMLWGVHYLNYYIIINMSKVIYKRGTFSKKKEYSYSDIQYARIDKKNKMEILLVSGKSIVVPVNDPIRASIFLNKCGNKVEAAKAQEEDNYIVCAPIGLKIFCFLLAIFLVGALYFVIKEFITVYDIKEINVVGIIFVLIISIVWMYYMCGCIHVLFNYIRIDGNNVKFFRVFHKTLELRNSDIQKIELEHTVGSAETLVTLFYKDKEIFRYGNEYNNSEKMKIFLKEIPVAKEKYVHREDNTMNIGS